MNGLDVVAFKAANSNPGVDDMYASGYGSPPTDR